MTNFPDDNELLLGFKNPETREKSFTLLIKKYQERLYFHIRRLVVSHEDADDILQDVFAKLWTNLDNFQGNSSLSTWIYRITTNHTLSFLELQKKKYSAASLSAHENYLSNRIKAEENFDGRLLEWRLQMAIQQLPEKQRVVFTLRYYDEMTYDEISDLMGTSIGAL
jgi:RNA polymerase sigma-70 factor (ECF subfamily)